MLKRLFVLLLLLVFCLPAASAQTGGNLPSGAFVETCEEGIFLALNDGVYRLNAQGQSPVKISSDRASMLQWVGGRLYYLAEEWGEDEYENITLLAQTPVSCLPDGSDRRELGESRAISSVFDWPDEDSKFWRIDSYVGYRDFTVTDSYIYFLGNAEISGRYECAANWLDENDKVYTVRETGEYRNGIVLYRMDANGENLTALTGCVGNSVAHIAVKDGSICLAGGYADTVYAYNFVNYAVLDADGNLLAQFHAPQNEEPVFVSDAGEFYHITDAVYPDDGGMIVSLSNSEGDFVASSLCRLSPDGTLSQLALEYGFVPAVMDGNTVYYVGSASENVYFDDSDAIAQTVGVYRKDADESGLGAKLASLPDPESLYQFRICVSGGYVYMKDGGGTVRRVSVNGGSVSLFGDNGF